jgi:sec-independent protein translocase protein TatA
LERGFGSSPGRLIYLVTGRKVMIGTTEALIIGGVILLLFGAKKLPELAKSMGKSKAAFDEGLKEGRSSEEDEDEDEEA